MGDFNSEPDSPKLMTFLEENLFYNHMKSKTCFKSDAGSTTDYPAHVTTYESHITTS